MNGRVYDYNVGRFMSVDPVIHGGSQGINPYSYIMNNPLAGKDPTGYSPEEEVEIKGTVTTEKVATTGSRIKNKTKTTVSGTVTKADGSTASFKYSQTNNGVGGATVSGGGGIKGGVSKFSSTTDIGSPQNLAKSDTTSRNNNNVNEEFGSIVPTENADLTAQVAIPGIPIPIPVPKSPEQLKREQELAKQFTDLLSDVLKGKVDSEDKIKAFRVEMSVNQRVFVTATGEVALFGNAMLWLNFGDRARAEVWLKQKQEQGFASAAIKSFDVPKQFADALLSMAVPQSEARRFPNAPQIADPTKADNQIGLRKHHIDQLQMAIHQGSGRVEQ